MNLRLRHYLVALLLHAILFAFIFVGVQCSHTVQPPMAIQGTIVNPSQVKQQQAGAEKQRTVEKTQAVEEARRQATITAESELREKQQAQLKQQQQAQLKMQQEARQAAEQVKQQAQKLAQRKAALQKRAEAQQKVKAERQAQLKAQQQAAEKKAQQEAAVEAKQKAAAAAKKKVEQEAKAKATMAKKQEAEKQAELKKQRAAELQQQLGTESQALKQTSQNAWVAEIKSKLASNWLRPQGVSDTIICTVRVELADNGHVLSVQVIGSSGNSLFDDSVRRAVLKSDPLPLPVDPTAFQSGLKLHFTPQDLQNAG